MPKELACDEAEFCVMLSNLLENSLDAAKSYIAISIKHLNHQLSLNVKNDYEGELKRVRKTIILPPNHRAADWA